MSPEIFTILVLLLLSGFFSGSETALFTLPWWRLHLMKQSDSRMDRWVALIMKNPRRLLATILLGNTIVNVAASSIAEGYLEHHLPEQGLWIAIAVMTMVLLVAGEITPKTISLNYAETVSRLAAGPLRVVAVALYPLRFIMEWLTEIITRLFTGSGTGGRPRSGADFLQMVREGAAAGIFSGSERDIIERILKMEHVSLDRIMVPRTKMIVLPEDVSADEAKQVFLEKNLRRIPLYRGSLDRITGVLYAKDLLYAINREDQAPAPREIMRAPIFTPGCVSIKQLFAEMKRSARHLAIILDEYGGTAGLVTYDDVLMSMFGRHSPGKPGATQPITAINRDLFQVDAATDLDELAERTGFNPGETRARTLNGWILERLDRIPEEGTAFQVSAPAGFADGPSSEPSPVTWRLEILQVSPRRVKMVRMKRLAGEESSGRGTEQ